MPSIFNRFYTQELNQLRNLSIEFSKENPIIAPMLGGESSDPDVERILEGVAFLNGLTLQKIEDESPEIAQELAQILVPQILRPLPAASILAFSPKVPLTEKAVIQAGTQIASAPVDGVSCIFKTTVEVEVEPIDLSHAELIEATNGDRVIRIHLICNKPIIKETFPDKLKFFLGDDLPQAANLLYLLQSSVKSMKLVDEQGSSVQLKNTIRFPGFEEELLPYPENAFPGFRLIQELLFFPQKYLFVEFFNLRKGQGSIQGTNIYLEINLGKVVAPTPEIFSTSFLLNAVPVVNLFEHYAQPISVNHEITEHLVLADGFKKEEHRIYSIDSVTGYRQGDSHSRPYVPFSLLNFGDTSNQASYRISLRSSIVSDQLETYLAVVYGKNEIPKNETLSIAITCTNRSLPESLVTGDISVPTSSSPERFSFKNIRLITAAIDPPSGEELLWSVIGHAALNFLSLGDVNTLRSILNHYNFKRSQDQTIMTGNEWIIEGIIGLNVTRESRLVRGDLLQGQHIALSCQETNWPSLGSLYLWGTVLNLFLSSYAGVNSYVRFEMEDKSTGMLLRWPITLGKKPLI